MIPIKIYLDEDVHPRIADALRLRGWEAVTTIDAKRQGTTDREQLQFAAAGRYTIISYNVADFARLHYEVIEAGDHHSGIILATQADPTANARALLAFVSTFSVEDVRDELLYLNNWMQS